MARSLTEKQKNVLAALKKYWSTHHVPPSISDLAKELGINKATAYEHLLALKKKGALIHHAKAGRTWRPADFEDQAANTNQAANKIPILGQVAAGSPLLAEENIEDYLLTDSQKTSDLFALRVKGSSMINAHIKDNDIVIADRAASIKKNDIVVALIDQEEATVKRFEKHGDKIKLLPENDDFAPIELSPDRVEILGKIIEVRRRIS